MVLRFDMCGAVFQTRAALHSLVDQYLYKEVNIVTGRSLNLGVHLHLHLRVQQLILLRSFT